MSSIANSSRRGAAVFAGVAIVLGGMVFAAKAFDAQLREEARREAAADEAIARRTLAGEIASAAVMEANYYLVDADRLGLATRNESGEDGEGADFALHEADALAQRLRTTLLKEDGAYPKAAAVRAAKHAGISFAQSKAEFRLACMKEASRRAINGPRQSAYLKAVIGAYRDAAELAGIDASTVSREVKEVEHSASMSPAYSSHAETFVPPR